MFTACRPPELNLFGPDYNHPPVSNCKGLMLCDRPITKYGENPVGDANLQRPTLRDAPKIVSLHHHQTKQRAVNMPGNKKVRDIKPISACYKGRFHLPAQVSSWFEYFLNIQLAQHSKFGYLFRSKLNSARLLQIKFDPMQMPVKAKPESLIADNHHPGIPETKGSVGVAGW